VKKIIPIFFLVMTALKGHAQADPHFSQYYAYPLWLNPGLAGVMDGDIRASAIYRNQWNSVMIPFSTQGFSADVSTTKNLNFGIDFMNQSAGDGGYKYVTGSVTIAYSVKFGSNKSQLLTMGIRTGMLSRRFDPTKFQSGDQWDPVNGFNPSIVSTDVLTKTGASSFDIGTGISYLDGSRGKPINFFGGAAMFHLTKPEDPFINSSNRETLPVRLSFHGGAHINISELASITPHALYMQQGNASETMLGLFISYTVTDDLDMMAGINYRLKDAVVPLAGFSYKNFLLGLSYDINNSDLGKSVTGTNSFEVSLGYLVKKNRADLKYLSCPRF
jgi:type IX secretion system PorP/SprF family membrane protein